jgi:hypothetical protein
MGLGVGLLILLLPIPGWLRGYELGLLTMGIVGAITWSIYLMSGKHTENLGRIGEELTAASVFGRRRQLAGWHLINGLTFQRYGDVDHILVGPGGIFAIESKYTTVEWKIVDGELVGPKRDPVKQARLGARKVESTLRSGKNPFEFPVQPVVVLWGPGAPDIETGWTIIRETLVAEGYRRRMWVPQLAGHPLPREMVRSVASKLKRELANRTEERPKIAAH